MDVRLQHEEVKDRIGNPAASAQGGKSNKRLSSAVIVQSYHREIGYTNRLRFGKQMPYPILVLPNSPRLKVLGAFGQVR